jgi:hypothetical protein
MAFSTAEVESLVHMLDKNSGFKRPDTQSAGYSNDAIEEVAAEPFKNQQQAAACIPLPSTVVDKTIGLPVPSFTKEGMELKAQQGAQPKPKPKGNAIWCAEEIPASNGGTAAPVDKNAAVAQAGDGKVTPEYEVLYKQCLGAEDVYLGVDFTKTGSSALCEGIVVKILLPKVVSAADITLDVEPYLLVLSSKDYALRAPLPLKVVAKKAAAKWDPSKKQLMVTLTTDLSDREVKLM